VDPSQYRLASLTEGGRFGAKLPPDVLDKLQAAFEQSRLNADPPAGVMLRSVTDNIGRALSVLQAADAASTGPTPRQPKWPSSRRSGLQQRGGIALVIAQAAKADWDAFAERVHDRSSGSITTDFYFQAPSCRAKRAVAWASASGSCSSWGRPSSASTWAVPTGPPSRKMLVDFAYYKLERSMSRSDFDTVEKKGRLVLKDKAAGMVLAALFQAYEEVYWKDLDAERARRIALPQAREQRRLMGEVDLALSKAAGGNFTAVWPDSKLYQSVVCQVVADLQSRGLLKEAK